MPIVTPAGYDSIRIPVKSTPIVILDNLGQFTLDNRNPLFDRLSQHLLDKPIPVYTEYIFDDSVKNLYPNLDLRFSFDEHVKCAYFESFQEYVTPDQLAFKNFLCSFNGESSHVGRRLLVAIIKKFNYYHRDYVSKNLTFTVDELDGHIVDICGEHERFYRKFFISSDSETFFQETNNFDYQRLDHLHNVRALGTKINESFIHVVSDAISTSNYPFYGEKFLYSVVNKGLFVSNAQVNWHRNLEKYYGFKPYTKLFDYRFDSIVNPIRRLVELMTMLSKFGHLSIDEWHDLYRIELDTIEFNYDHYRSRRYLECLKQWAN